MYLIKLDATTSTNSYLKKLCAASTIDDYTVVTAKYQTNGRGQMGSYWQSQASKNLICSVFKDTSKVLIEHQFYVSIATSLAIIEALQKLQIPKLNIKWPNDILSEQKKVCGILIENVIKTTFLETSIIGFGLNINQTEFNNLPQAGSLKLITGKVFHIEEVLQHIIAYFRIYFGYLEEGKLKLLKTQYEACLFRKDKPSTFTDLNGLTFTGVINGVTETGQLKILLEDNVVKRYNFKEIQLLY